MESPAIPKNEVGRLSALYKYHLLDTLPEKVYQDIISIAAGICNVPISLISLVDKDRCWFKAKVGLEQQEAPRQIAYAAHAINEPLKVMVVEDALADERFCDCPLVLQDPPMRFYAGTPLVTPDGFAIGTLCVIDKVPRQLNTQQIHTLEILAAQIVAQFELRLKIKEIKQLNNQLRNAYQELESFSYSAAHDLRSPLKNIQGLLSLLKSTYATQLDDIGKELIYSLITTSNRMDTILEDMWKLSKIGSGQLKLVTIDFTRLCQDVVSKASAMEHFHISIQEGMTMKGDVGYMAIALENLIGNAIKYSREKATPFIKIGQLQKEGKIIYFIQDTGTGFDIAYKDIIFHPFQRLHASEAYQGTGIGLSIVHKIIKRHGGKIWADSIIDKGSTFYFTID